MKTQHTPGPRDGSKLNWLVVNPEGKLLAMLDSESEAYWFTRNRAHANESSYFRMPIDYSSAPELLAALESSLLLYDIPSADLSGTAQNVRDQIRAAIAKAKGGQAG